MLTKRSAASGDEIERNAPFYAPSVSPQFVADVCHFFFVGFSKKRKQTIAEVDLTFCTEAMKEKKAQKARINSRKSSEREPRASAGEGGERVN